MSQGKARFFFPNGKPRLGHNKIVCWNQMYKVNLSKKES